MAANLQDLDRLIDLIDHCSPADEAEFAHEHVQGARTYWLGAMPTEFECNLELARQTLARMADTEARRAAENILASLSKN